jgi:hypothetical protein
MNAERAALIRLGESGVAMAMRLRRSWRSGRDPSSPATPVPPLPWPPMPASRPRMYQDRADIDLVLRVALWLPI